MLFLLVVSYVLVELMASLDSFCSLKLLEDKNSLRRLRGDLIGVFNILMRGSGWAGTNIFTPMTSNKTGGNSMKLKLGRRIRLGIRRKDFHLEGPQGNHHSTKPDRIREAFGQHSQAHGVTPGAVLCRARS